MKAPYNPLLTRGVDALSENDADTVHGLLWGDDAFSALIMRYAYDDTMTRMDLALEIEARIEALDEVRRREG